MVSYSTIIILVIYFAVTMLLTYLINFKFKIGGDFSIGNQQFGWLTAGTSIIATYISAMTFIGLPGWIYHSGMQALSIHLNYPLVIFLATVFFVPIFYQLKLKSIYEFLEKRFGTGTRVINSAVFIITQVISSGVILYATSLVISMIFPISLPLAIIAISLFTVIYTFIGGISTVIWTDVWQSIVLLIGSVTIFIWLVNDENVNLVTLPNQFLTIINTDFNMTEDTTIWGALFAVSFLHLSVFGSNQLIIQRVLATKNLKAAQNAMLFCGYSIFFIYLFFAIVGLLLYSAFAGKPFNNQNEVILSYILNHTHPIIIGLTLAALAAAAMSTLDSSYNSIGTVFTEDFYKRFCSRQHTPEHFEKVARLSSLIASLLIIIPAILSISNKSVLQSIASIASIFVGIRLGSFLLGMLSKKANQLGIYLATGFTVVMVSYLYYQNFAWPWFAPIGTLTFLVIGYLSSLYMGNNTSDQIAFYHQQKGLILKPNWQHWGLLLFFVITLLFAWHFESIYLFFVRN